MLFSALALVAALSACDNASSPLEGPSTGIELSLQKATLGDGDSLALQVYSSARPGARRASMDPGRVTWSSSAPQVASVSGGVVRGLRPGQATITATSPEGWSGSADVAVHPVAANLEALLSETLEGEVGMPLAEAVAFRITDRHGTPMPDVAVRLSPRDGEGSVSPRVQTSDVEGVVRVSWTLGTRAGPQRLMANLVNRPDRWTEAEVRARPGPVASVEVLPPADTAKDGSALVVRAKLDDFYGNSVPGVPVSWTVVSGGGSIRPASESTDDSGTSAAEWTLGSADEEQIVGARPGNGNGGGLGVLNVDLRGVTVTPSTGTVEMRESLQLTAEERDRRGDLVEDGSVRWTSSNQGVASVSSEGLVHGITPGTATITATSGGRSGSATITVKPEPEPEPEPKPEPKPDPVEEGEPGGEDSGGNPSNEDGGTSDGGSGDGGTPPPSDGSGDEGGSSGGGSGGSSGGSGSTEDPYAPGEPTGERTITIYPDSVSLGVGATFDFIAVERWADGQVNPDANINWESSDRGVARVDGNGRVTAVADGEATIRAFRSGRSGFAKVVVGGGGSDDTNKSGADIGPVPATITLTPGNASLSPTETIHVQATVKDQNGNEITTDQLHWTSSNASVIQVQPNGTGAYVSAGSQGTATVQAALEGVTGSASFQVESSPSSWTGGTIPAFPGAEGYGAIALNTCDRSTPHVFRVTNLNDSGSGSFRQAMADAQAAPAGQLKVVVFRVGGYIRTNSRIIFSGNCLYVAGQTAPGDGVTIRGRGLEFDRDVRDVVIRHLRIRLGSGAADDGILIRKGENLVFDHLSVSWTDRTLIRFSRTQINRSGPIRNVTIQRSLLGESLASHPTGVQIGGEGDTDEGGTLAGWKEVTHFSIHRNALVSNNHRNINARGLYIETVNNVVHNWNLDGGQTGRGAIVDWVNNYIQKGPMSRANYVPIGIGSGHVTSAPYYEPSIHLSGNVSLGGSTHSDQNTSTSASNWTGGSKLIDWYHNNTGGDVAQYRRNTSIHGITARPYFPVTLRDAYSARNEVLQGVGADRGLDCRGGWRVRRDAVDSRLLADIQSGGGWSSGGGPSNEGSVGGFPSLSSGSACADSSGNGIPDEWLLARGLDIHDRNVAGRIGSGGYSYLEHFLNGTNP